MDYPFDSKLSLAEASALPSEVYFCPEFYAREMKNVFGKEWHWVCRADEVKEPGQWITSQIGYEPVIVSREVEGSLRAFSNVCRHRAAKVCRQPFGKSTRLRCQYHGWSYDLNGKLKTAPEFEGVEHFDKEKVQLPAFSVRELGPWVFVSLSAQPTDLLDQWSPFCEESKDFEIEKMRFVKRVEYSVQCNWKVFVDNYLDGGYHINTLHPDLAGVIPYSEYRSFTFPKSSLQTSPLRQGHKTEINSVRKGVAQYWWMYPNLMINLYEGVMDLNLVLPEGPEKCRVIFDFYFKETGQEQQSLIEKSLAVAHQVQLEDQEICEEVQRGLHSQFYSSGRFSVTREKTAYHFHQLIHQEVSS